MFTGIGTAINIVTILVGGSLGVFIGNRISAKLRVLILDALGCITIISAADALIDFWNPKFQNSLPSGWPLLVVVFSLVLGAIIGTFLKLEERLEKFGDRLRIKFSHSGDSGFIEGFVTSSLIFVIGPLAILGSISDGMGTGIDQLVLKSTLDGFAALAFAATFGWGVALSSIPVGIYQFSWTAVGVFLGSILDEYQILAMTCVGGILLIGISLRLLKIKVIEIGNLLPALALAPLIASFAHQLI